MRLHEYPVILFVKRGRLLPYFSAVIIPLLAGCAGMIEQLNLPESSGRVFAGDQLHAARIVLDCPEQLQIRVEKTAKTRQGSKPTIWETDKGLAKRKAQALSESFASGVQTRFSSYAAMNGLSIRGSDPSLPIIKLKVVRSNMNCYEDSCDSWLDIETEVLGVSGRVIWQSKTTFNDAAKVGSTSGDPFDVYSSGLFAAMKKDQLLPD